MPKEVLTIVDFKRRGDTPVFDVVVEDEKGHRYSAIFDDSSIIEEGPILIQSTKALELSL